MTLIKSISGIRGTIGGPAGENLTPPDVVKFTTAYVRLIARRNPGKKLTIVVGRDARISGEMVSNLVEGTLLACGADVVNVGLCTTPGTEMAVIGKKADGGIIITASHNPRQWNALKLLNSDGEFLNDAEGKQVLAMSEEEDYDYPAIDAIGHVLSREDFNDEHIRRVLALPLVDVEAVRKRRFKVVVDAVNSVGGIVECRVQGVPLGLGQPFFDSAESMIAHLLFSVPAVKGVEFGSGFAGARMRGSENNDPFLDVEGTTATNNAGGINGGLTNGNELVVRAAVKPTPSIGREQMTYNLATNKVEPLMIRGRHDVCVALRGAVVAEAAVAIALANFIR